MESGRAAEIAGRAADEPAVSAAPLRLLYPRLRGKRRFLDEQVCGRAVGGEDGLYPLCQHCAGAAAEAVLCAGRGSAALVHTLPICADALWLQRCHLGAAAALPASACSDHDGHHPAQQRDGRLFDPEFLQNRRHCHGGRPEPDALCPGRRALGWRCWASCGGARCFSPWRPSWPRWG